MFKNQTTNDSYPKTLMIRNEDGGMIWQVYHVDTIKEAELLATNAYKNAFYGSTLEDYQPKYEETWKDWRETEGGKKIINSK